MLLNEQRWRRYVEERWECVMPHVNLAGTAAVALIVGVLAGL
jgi:hypothetical protein